MEGPISSGKYNLPTYAEGLQVMLVDDDFKSLFKIRGKLMKFRYEVTAVNLASGALSMIRENKTCYDFVLADINLQDLDYESFVRELCQREIPLIWMSSSYDRAEKLLRDGASFVLKKPISSNKLELLWQLVFSRRSNQKESHNRQALTTEPVSQRHIEEGFTTTNNQQEGSKRNGLIDDQQGNKQTQRRRICSNKVEHNQNQRGKRADGNKKGRKRTVWHSERERQFQEALSAIGNNATARSIFEKMKDRSITLKQVASHFQKSRSLAQKTNVNSGATSSPVTNNLSSALACRPGKRHQSQLPEGGVAGKTELGGSVQGEITSGFATNSENFVMNFSVGIQNQEPIGGQALAAGSSNQNQPLSELPVIFNSPYANQNQDLTTNLAATFNSNCKNQLPAGVATTNKPLGFEQANIITSGIATNSENAPMDFTYRMQNLQTIVELAPAAGSSRHPAYGNQNQDLNTIRAAPFGTRHQSQLPGGGVAGTTEFVGSVQGEITSGIATNSENFLMNGVGIQYQEPMVEQALAAGSSNQNQPLSELPVIFYEDETVDWESILNSQNPGDIEQNQEPMGEQAAAAVSSNHGFSSRDSEEADGFINMERFESCHGVYGESTDM